MADSFKSNSEDIYETKAELKKTIPEDTVKIGKSVIETVPATGKVLAKGVDHAKKAVVGGAQVTHNVAKFAGEKTIGAIKTTASVEKEGAVLVEKAAVKAPQKARDYWHGLGPGLVTGASDDDPSGIATYSQAGAKYGFQLLWLAPITFPLMAIVQEMCARIGLVTGRGLAHNIRRFFPKWILFSTMGLLFLANTINIGADLGAMAQSTKLVLNWLPAWFLVIAFTVLSLFLQIYIPYEKYAKYLKYLALILLVYVVTAFVISDFPWWEVLKNGVIPSLHLGKEQIILICGILGTTISPYLFFWQTSQEVEELKVSGQTNSQLPGKTDPKTLRKMRADVWTGMLLSNVVMFFIIAVCAVTLFPHGVTNIGSAADAAKALEPLVGGGAFLLFALGIIGTGLLAAPVLAGSASYAISESFGWKEGLYRPFRQAAYFYGVIIVSMLIGLLINFLGFDPIKALIYAAVLNGIVAPVILVLIVLLSSNKNIMGKYANHSVIRIIGWIITVIMVLAAVAAIISFF